MTSVPLRRAFAAGFGAAALTATLIAGAAPAAAKPKPNAGPPPVNLQILALNDFHGQLEPPSGSSSRLPGYPTTTAFGGAEYLATQIRQLEAESKKQNTVTVAAGDLIGASPLLSAAFHDEPTIDSLNRIGLDYASVGNHEFDEGPEELLRIQHGGCHPDDGCSDPELPYQGADFQYLSANAFSEEGGVDDTLLPPYAVHKVQGIKVGFIGMTLEGTPGVVTPSGVAGLDFGDEAETANRYADELQAQGVEAIVVLLHEGGRQNSSGTINSCTGLTGPITQIVPEMSEAIDVVITGHTHQAYNCTIDGRLVTSASSAGRLVTDIDLTLDRRTGDVLTAAAANVPVERTVPRDAEQTALIARWRELLGPIAGEVVGEAAAVLSNSRETLYTTGTGDDAVLTLGESPIGNLIADAQWATTRTTTGAVAALMNPGGVRAEINQGAITYEEAFTVQPFGNYLTTLTLTGAQLQCVLEQQFVLNTVLQPSSTLRYSVDPSGALGSSGNPCTGSRVPDASVTINGVPVDPAASYRITVNNFLADGGDSFSTLTSYSARTDVVSPEDDLAALVQYLGANRPISPPATDRITVLP